MSIWQEEGKKQRENYFVGKEETAVDEKEITNATNMLAIQYFVAYSKMKELTGDPEEAIRLTNGLFTAMFEGNNQQPGNDSLLVYWDRR